jgi:nucleotide-binding universal stress UspA family protein
LTLHNKILVAVDGSKYSEVALKTALSIAKTCESELYAIHVIYSNPELMTVVGFEQQLEEEAEKLLEGVQKKAAKEKVQCETIIKFHEQPYKEIVAAAKAKKINLIVMGTHGRTGLEKMLLGSVAQRVIGHAPCAVLVVPR